MQRTKRRLRARTPRALGRLSVLALVSACQPTSDVAMPPPDTTTETLSIALQEGFDGDHVVVRLGDEEVLNEAALTTDVRIGLATSLEATVAEYPVPVEVEVPSQGLRGQTTAEEGGPLHLGVSVVDGEIRFRWSEQPFGYL